MRRAALLAVVGTIFFCSPAMPQGPAAADDTARLTMTRTEESLTLDGAASSTAHRERLLHLAAEWAPAIEVTDELELRTPLPPGWALVTEMSLRVLAMTYDAAADIGPGEVTLSGYTADGAAYAAAVALLREHLLPDMTLDDNVVAVQRRPDFNEQCRRMLALATAERQVAFDRDSADIGTAAFALLDELAEIAADCPAIQIQVTGHTDSAGDEALNLAVSKARATAVIDYLTLRGIDRGRLAADGVGSEEPLVAGDGPRARAQNRRVEFEFTFAEPADDRP